MAAKKTFDENAMWKAYNDFHYLCDTSRFRKLVSRVEMMRMIGDLPGDIVDAGAFKGISTIQFAQMLEVYQPGSRTKVVAFDTFDAVFPRSRDDETAAAASLMKDYEENAFGHLTEALERLGLSHRVALVRGDIVETMPRYIAENPGFRIALLHSDLDAYEPTLATLRTAWPRIVRGGMVIFDEYAIENWGEADAADEFLSELSGAPRLQRFPVGPTPTAFLVKDTENGPSHGTSV